MQHLEKASDMPKRFALPPLPCPNHLLVAHKREIFFPLHNLMIYPHPCTPPQCFGLTARWRAQHTQTQERRWGRGRPHSSLNNYFVCSQVRPSFSKCHSSSLISHSLFCTTLQRNFKVHNRRNKNQTCSHGYTSISYSWCSICSEFFQNMTDLREPSELNLSQRFHFEVYGAGYTDSAELLPMEVILPSLCSLSHTQSRKLFAAQLTCLCIEQMFLFQILRTLSKRKTFHFVKKSQHQQLKRLHQESLMPGMKFFKGKTIPLDVSLGWLNLQHIPDSKVLIFSRQSYYDMPSEAAEERLERACKIYDIYERFVARAKQVWAQAPKSFTTHSLIC